MHLKSGIRQFPKENLFLICFSIVKETYLKLSLTILLCSGFCLQARLDTEVVGRQSHADILSSQSK